MAISKEQQHALRNAARAANRRLERASKGQYESLRYNIQGYHVRKNAAGELRFSQAAAKTEAEYRSRIAELNKFMEARTSTKKGWKSIKEEGIRTAGGTLEDMGYEVTDDELKNIIEETGGSKKNPAAFYRALENVTAAKMEQEKGELSKEELQDAISSRRTDQQAVAALLKARRDKGAEAISGAHKAAQALRKASRKVKKTRV